MSGEDGKGGDEQDTKPKKKTTSITNKLLRRVGSRSGRRTVKWASSLAGEGDATDEMEASISDPFDIADQKAPNSMAGWIDGLFEAFQQYEVEFNGAVADRALRVKTELPMFTATFRNTGAESGTFSGKVHTQDWALVIRGNHLLVEGFIVPCTQLITLSGNSSRFVRFFEIEVRFGNGVSWYLQEKEIRFGELRSLAKQLFAGLIKVARAENDPNAPFVYMTAEQMQTLKSADSKLPVQQSNIFEGEPLHSFPPTSSAESEWIVGKANPNPSQSEEGRRNSQEYAKIMLAEYSKQEKSEPDFAQSCLFVVKALDREIEKLSREGTAAFQQQNMDAVNKTMQRTSRITKLKESVLLAMTEWQKEFTGD